MITYCKNNFVLIQPVGRLDLQGGVAISQAITKLQPECHKFWVIDLTNIDFVDSAGLTALVNLLSAANSHQCNFALCNPTPSVKLVLEITRLDQVFQILEAVETPDDLALTFNQTMTVTQTVTISEVMSAA